MYKEWKSSKDHSFPYITGNGISTYCRYVLNYDNYRENKDCQNKDWYFVKTDYIDTFFRKHRPNKRFVLFTHNSDYSINESHRKILDDNDGLMYWFAQNVDLDHPKLKALPIGIANAGYSHGKSDTLTKVRDAKNEKDKMFYVNFTITNNNTERKYCLEQTGLQLENDVDGGWDGFAGGYHMSATFEKYLENMSKCFFCISPKGNGIDCHRTWEALYLGTIPVTTKSLVVNQHKDFPILILDDWSQFKTINFSKELYDKIWNNWNIGDLHIDRYMQRVRGIIENG